MDRAAKEISVQGVDVKVHPPNPDGMDRVAKEVSVQGVNVKVEPPSPWEQSTQSEIGIQPSELAKENTIRFSRMGSTVREKLKQRLQQTRNSAQGEAVTEDQLLDIITDLIEERRTNKFYKVLIAVAVCVVIVLITVFTGVTVAVTEAYKDTKEEDGAFADYKHHVLKTSPSATNLPLYTAPVLSQTQLSSIENVRISVPSEETGSRLTRYVRVQSIEHYSRTRVVIVLVGGEELHMWDGQVSLHDAGGAVTKLCAADVACASFQVSSSEEQAEYVRLADAALETLAARRALESSADDEVCQDGCAANWGACDPSCCCAFPDWDNGGATTIPGLCNVFSWGTQCRPYCSEGASCATECVAEPPAPPATIEPPPPPLPPSPPAGDAQCPPAGWDRCGGTWPPLASGYCCSAAGYYGVSEAHCSAEQGGINALDECCTLTDAGYIACQTACPDPPTVCTGVAAIDAVLYAANLGCKIGLSSLNDVYTWEGFCLAVRQFNALDNPTLPDNNQRRLYLGDESEANGAATGLANIAGLLAQCMWESGGDAPFTACDENHYRDWDNAACTQRSDMVPYASLNDRPWACVLASTGQVDPQMTMRAETYASWTPGPLECAPDTITQGCCWWGRGAIQTTGPNNYGLLQEEVIDHVDELDEIDLCTNPEAICQNDETKWLGAIFYWANNVQGYSWAAQSTTFEASLGLFVESGFSLDASVVCFDGSSGCADYCSGTGGVVNNGYWGATPHGSDGRLRYFNFIMAELIAGGMVAEAAPPSPPSPPPTPQPPSPTPTPPQQQEQSPPPSPPPPPSTPPGECVNGELDPPFAAFTCETYENLADTNSGTGGSCSGWVYNTMCGYCAHEELRTKCCRCSA